MSFSLEIDFSKANVDDLIRQRVKSLMVEPELVLQEDLTNKKYYKRFQDISNKNLFRESLLNKLSKKWEKIFGISDSKKIEDHFVKLVNIIEQNGALVFADLVTKSEFESFIAEYQAILNTSGSKSIIHTFVDFRNHHHLLTQISFSNVSLHPLLISLISYSVGGAIRIVDARGKDAEPISILAQDNMLHIDNTPFNDEYKILLTWERNKASGPKGQNFVYIPSTHKGARNCFVKPNGDVWSTENASIFITQKSIEKTFEFQRKIRKENRNTVVEVQDENSPLCTVFAAGSLVHHRYRTVEGNPRSCLIIALHRSKDNPGEFVNEATYSNIQELLISSQNESSDSIFIDTLLKSSELIGNKISDIYKNSTSSRIINQEERQLTETEIENWKKIVTSAPSIEELKVKDSKLPCELKLEVNAFIKFVAENLMKYDKHGPLDLILYSDNHEESRKWARNRIREMKLPDIGLRLNKYSSILSNPEISHLLLPEQLSAICSSVISISNQLKISDLGSAEIGEKITPSYRLKSIVQLLKDLQESLNRCYSIQNYLSTSLFIFWATDELQKILNEFHNVLFDYSSVFLRNYISTALLTDYVLKRKI